MNIATELSEDRLRELLNAPCEMERLDFKETLDLSTARECAELAKDVLAMANSGGGHLVIGVEDTTRRPIGISPAVAFSLKDTKSINDKLRRYSGGHIVVHFTTHCLTFGQERMNLALIFIPASRNKVPAQENGCFEDANKKQVWVFRKGDVYIRKGDQSVKVETPEDLLRLAPIPPLPVNKGVDLSAFQNPYDFARAAKKDMFKGREAEVRELLQAAESGTHTAIFGLQRMGKTSLVKETLEDRIIQLPALEKSIKYAMIDFQGVGTHATTYKTVLEEIAKTIATAISLSQLQSVKEQLAKFAKWYEGSPKRDMLKAYSALLEKLASSAPGKIVLFLDEFSELCLVVQRNEELFRRKPERVVQEHPHNTLIDVDLMQWFSSVAKNDVLKNKIVFVFALRPFIAEFDARHNLQILKVLKPIMLYYLDEKSAKALIREPLRGHINVNDEACDYLFRITAGHPYLMQFMLKELVDRAKRERRQNIHKVDVLDLEHKMVSEGPAYDAQFKVLDSDYSVTDVMDPAKGAKRGKGVLAIIAKLGATERGTWVELDSILAKLLQHGYATEDSHELLDQLCRAKIIEQREIEGALRFRLVVPLLSKRYKWQNLFARYFPTRRLSHYK